MSNEVNYTFNNSIFGKNIEIIDFYGIEKISSTYNFTIRIISNDVDIDFDKLINSDAYIKFNNEDGQGSFIHGIIEQCSIDRQLADERYEYVVQLVPKLKLTKNTFANEVYLDKSIPEIVNEVLVSIGLKEETDYTWSLINDYPAIQYTSQYNENNLNFIQRKLEHNGIYYYFTHSSAGEKIIFSDNKDVEPNMDVEGKIAFVNKSLPEASDHHDNFVDSLSMSKKIMSAELLIRDYSDIQPSVDVKGESDISSQGIGKVYMYGENVADSQEAENIADIRAQEIACQERCITGKGTISSLRSGSIINVKDHYRGDLNKTFKVTSIKHEALKAEGNSGLLKYRTTFEAIPSEVQFRPARTAYTPRITGHLIGRVDAEGDGKYAQLDEYGRYKVIMLFDKADRDGGKASHWIRMAQPYTGTGTGMHFPLTKGAEVLLTFTNGNTDLPVISGTVPNAQNISVSVAQSNTCNTIKTQGGSIEFEDRDGHQSITQKTGGCTTITGNVRLIDIFGPEEDV